MNPQELYEAYMSVYESDDRREMRRLASQERQAEKKAEQNFRKNTPVGGKKSGPKLSATKMSKKEGENFAKQTMNDAEYIAKKAKGHTVGNPFPEEFDYFDQVLSELIDAGYTAEEALEYMVQEAEGSYGQTPKARAAMGKLAVSRMNKPASEYSQRGEKTKKVKAAEKHTRRQDRLASGNNRYGSRGPMDQSRRNWSRGADDYGHTGYDGDGYGGSVTKNPKKLRKQKAMGEISKENYNNHDASIIEGKKEFPHKKVDRQVYDAMDSGETAGDSGNRAKETRDYARADKMRSVAAKHGGKTRASEEFVGEAQYARNNPEKYERDQERSQSSRQRRMNDPKTGINSKAFNDFYNAQMASKKKKASN